jgi:hypothetical protein
VTDNGNESYRGRIEFQIGRTYIEKGKRIQARGEEVGLMARNQEEAFRAYYSSMSTEELLTLAANRSSYIEAAQKALSEELKKRNLSFPEPAGAEARRLKWLWARSLTRLVPWFHHPVAH